MFNKSKIEKDKTILYSILDIIDDIKKSTMIYEKYFIKNILKLNKILEKSNLDNTQNIILQGIHYNNEINKLNEYDEEIRNIILNLKKDDFKNKKFDDIFTSLDNKVKISSSLIIDIKFLINNMKNYEKILQILIFNIKNYNLNIETLKSIDESYNKNLGLLNIEVKKELILYLKIELFTIFENKKLDDRMKKSKIIDILEMNNITQIDDNLRLKYDHIVRNIDEINLKETLNSL